MCRFEGSQLLSIAILKSMTCDVWSRTSDPVSSNKYQSGDLMHFSADLRHWNHLPQDRVPTHSSATGLQLGTVAAVQPEKEKKAAKMNGTASSLLPLN